MVKNAFLTDLLREVRKSAGRFLGVFAIVLLGVSIFAGLGATGSVMKELGDRYFREQSLMDLRILSTYGLTERDIEAIRETEGVASVQPAYTLDAMTAVRDTGIILKLHSLPPEDADEPINRPFLISGRIPERSGEALVEPALLDRLGLEIGDSFRLESGTSADLRGGLRTDRYRIVGVARSPLYYANMRGTSSIGNGSVDYYMLVPQGDFRSGIYSEAYVRAEGTAGLYTYSPRYADLLEQLAERLEEIGEHRAVQRKGELTRSAFEALDAAEQELLARRRTAYEELDRAERQLRDSRGALARGRLEMAAGELDAMDAKEEITGRSQELSAAITQLDIGLAEVAATERSLRETANLLGRSEADLLAAEQDLVALKGDLDADIGRLLAGKEALLEGLERAAETKELTEQALLDAPGDPVLTAQRDAIAAQIADLQSQLDELNELEASAGFGMRQLRLGMLQVAANRQELETGRFQVEQGLASIAGTQADLERQRLTLLDGLGTLRAARTAYEDGLTELWQSRLTLSRSSAALRAAEQELAWSREDTLRQLDAAERAVAEGRSALYGIDDPVWYVLDRGMNESYASYESDADKIHALGRVIPLLFFLVAALVSLTTMSRLVEEQRTDMGTLKALGYSSGAILAKYLLYAFAPTFFGSLAGGWIGQRILPAVILDAYQGIYPLSPYRYSLHTLYWFGGLLLAVCSTLFTTIYACVSELRDVPSTLMRHRAPETGKKTPLERVTPLWRRLSFLYKITFRNAFRYKKRFYMTILGVGGCTALLVTGFGLQESVSGLVTRQYGEIQHYGMAVSFAETLSSGEIASIRALIDGDPVARESFLAREKRMDISAHGGTESATLVVPGAAEEAEHYLTLRERVGHRALPLREGVILTEKLADLLGVSPGDEVTLKDQDDESFTVLVAGVCESYFMHSAYISPAYYTEIFGEPPKMNTVYVLTAPGADQNEADRLSSALLERRTVSSVALTSRTISRFNDTMGSLNTVITVIIVAAGALAFIVLLNLTSINITERAREIATIQVLGFRDTEVAAYIYRENRIVALMGTLLGLFFGKYLQQYVMRSAEPSFVMFSRELGAINFVASGALTMFFVICVDRITSGRLRKINMVEALKSNE